MRALGSVNLITFSAQVRPTYGYGEIPAAPVFTLEEAAVPDISSLNVMPILLY